MPHHLRRLLILGLALSVMGDRPALASPYQSAQHTQATQQRPSVWVPDGKRPGHGPIPIGTPSWQPFQPSGSSPPPAWTPQSGVGSAPPSWKPAAPQGTGPTWRALQQPTL